MVEISAKTINNNQVVTVSLGKESNIDNNKTT